MRRSTTALRTQILDEARAEFARHGLAGARIDRIAGAARASKERLYAHFGDKESLFREVVAIDVADFYRSVTLHADAVPEFAGAVYDLARTRPEHLRMITWAKLEGFVLDEPRADGEPIFEKAVATIEGAQAAGQLDPAWEPADLLVLLFALGFAWAHAPGPDAASTDSALIARQRSAAVEAARRIVSTPR